MGTPETSREPCPDRILDDLGGAFAMGAVGGSVFHFIKGAYNSPKGERFLGGANTVRMSAPRTGGGFAVWGGLFSTFDCGMVYIRQKEDPWNSIFAGARNGNGSDSGRMELHPHPPELTIRSTRSTRHPQNPSPVSDPSVIRG